MFNIIKVLLQLQIKKNRYELRNRTNFTIQSINPVHYGLENLSYLGPKYRETMPLDLKQTKSLSEFKAEIKILKIEKKLKS